VTGSEDLKSVGNIREGPRGEGGHGETRNIPSMRMLMNRICIALSGLLRPNIVLRVISVRAAAAVLSWKDRKF
jgi:hypothetical protein